MMLRKVLSSGTNEHDTSSISTYVYHPVDWIRIQHLLQTLAFDAWFDWG